MRKSSLVQKRMLRTLAVLVLTAFLGLATAAPAQAGILDTIKGFFGKATDTVKGWFSGGGEQEFVKLLQQVAESQKALSEKQTNLQALYQQRGQAGAKPNDAALNERLNDIAQTARQNEALYLSLLKARDELVKNKKDISKYQDALTQLTEGQNKLEEQYQELQKYNKEIGSFTPPATVASAGAGKTSAGGEPDWRDPSVQGFIDEWLQGVGLTEWGQYVAPGVKAAGPPDHGAKQRHEWVWENMWTKTAGANMTLGDYVKARMAGKSPSLVSPNRTATFQGGEVATAPAVSVQAAPQPAPVASQMENQPAAASTGDSAELRDVLDQEKALVASIQKMNTEGQGNSESAQKLYESLKAVQSRKNALMAQQSTSGSSTGSITEPR
ncbi:MAG: hypothetical protein HY814_07380 [Candidatus Riflebacteria bacterium]|nr:hypothetical protein [Candidatus Riflebacteria bacterium]